jgi:hypothetical protein
VDVDGTLVLWDDSAGFGDPGRDAWRANAAVVGYAEAWLAAHPGGRLVVWSSGGRDYAEAWGRRLLGHLPHEALSKLWPVGLDGAEFVDDSPFDAWAHLSTHPSGLPGAAPP